MCNIWYHVPFSFHHYLSFTSLSCHCICCSYALFSKVTIKVPHIPIIIILHVAWLKCWLLYIHVINCRNIFQPTFRFDEKANLLPQLANALFVHILTSLSWFLFHLHAIWRYHLPHHLLHRYPYPIAICKCNRSLIERYHLISFLHNIIFSTSKALLTIISASFKT